MGIKIKPKNKKYIRLVAGIIILILGGVFMLVPFIPLGYVFLIVALLLLSTYSPPFKRLIGKIRSEDDKDRVEAVEEKLEDGEEVVSKKIVDEEN
ncbi:MAG: hypothetical protein R6V23_10605 [Bacteroidales bacterium]